MENPMPEIEHQEALVAVRDPGLIDRPTSALDAHCRRALQEEYERERRRIRRRVHPRVRRSVVVPLGVLLACGLGAVGYAALTTSSTPSAGIECHLDGSGTVTHLDGRSASKICAQLWPQSDVVDGVRVPPGPLHACVAKDGSGAIHVFASADVDICSRIGLQEVPAAGTDPDSRSYGRFVSRLTDRLDSAAFTCPTAAQARELVQAELMTSGLTDWTIKDAGSYDQQHPCASLALDSTSRTVTLVPGAR
jgi:hypothetical protein